MDKTLDGEGGYRMRLLPKEIRSSDKELVEKGNKNVSVLPIAVFSVIANGQA